MDPAKIFSAATQAHQAGRFAEAVKLYEQVLELAPEHPETLHLRGALELQQGHYAAAVPWFERTIAANPDHASAYNNLAAAHIALGRSEEAAQAAARAIVLSPTSISALKNRASALNDLSRFDDALEPARRAAQLAPNDFQANLFLITTLIGLDRRAEALIYCEKGIALNPSAPETLFLRAVLASELKSPEEAIDAYDAAIRADPEMPIFAGEAFHTRMQICEWDGLDERLARLLARTEAGQYASNPFYFLSVPCKPEQQKRAAELHFQRFAGDVVRESPVRSIPRRRKIRIGYFSSDFGDHAVGHVILPLLEQHDHGRFEVLGVALAGDAGHPSRAPFLKVFDRLIDLSGKTTEEVVIAARAEELDVAIDLNGYTQGARTRSFGFGLAPVQVNFLGYPGTLGAAAYDYIIADPIVAPFDNRDHFRERIAQLPHSFFIGGNNKRREISRSYTRRDAGLPDQGVVFCAFNGHFKITPDVFDIWMRVLNRVDRSVLWLSEGSEAGRRNLKREVQTRGVAPERLVFAPKIIGANYLARLQLADLFLDTFYYNAHSTACDALMMGLPVLTKPGETFASRVAASLLTALGLPELIVRDGEQYESMAIQLGLDPAMRAGIRRRVEENAATSTLFDVKRHARNMERAYAHMVRRHDAGAPPEEFRVEETMPTTRA